MKYVTIIIIAVIAIAIVTYLGTSKSCEGFDTRNKSAMKGCVEPTRHSGNCSTPGKSGDIYMTKGIDDAKEEIWAVCPYECPKGSLSDDVSICKYDKQCATVDVKTGKFNHACIIKLNIHPNKVDRSQVKKFSSKKEMEKALGYKICSHKHTHEHEDWSRHGETSSPDMRDMIIDPSKEGQHGTPVAPGGGAGPHGSQLPNPGRPGPGMPSAHGGNPDLSCYPPPPKHYSGHHPGISTVSHAPGQHSLPHSPHAPFDSHGGFVPPHSHGGHSPHKPPHPSHSPHLQYQCECS